MTRRSVPIPPARCLSRPGWLLRTLTALVCGLLVAISAQPVQGQVRDRRLHWRTIQTEHFDITYPQPLGLMARRTAALCERAHLRLSHLLGPTGNGRVQVLLTDDSDAANGSATVVPYNQIRLFASAPEDLSPLGDYDDWLNVLIVHEHTHVLHLDTIGGIPALINRIFGKIYAPNQVQPRWFIEGLAVHEESRETTAGRLRSSMFEMYLRMDALEDRLLRMDELSTGVDRWPRGNAYYLYGSRFVDYIAEEHGRESLTAISQDYGRQLIPYSLNRAARRATGLGFTELYDRWQAQVQRSAAELVQRIEEEGRIEGRRLTFHGEQARAPRFVDASTVVYSASIADQDPSLRRVSIASEDPEEVGTAFERSLGNSYPAPASDGIYFNQLEAHRDIYFFGDLFRWDPQSERSTRLTHGWRIGESDVSPDGRRIAFTVNGAGTRHLMIADTADIEATAEVLYRNPRYGQVYTPRFSPDGTKVAVSLWREGGYRDIGLIDVDSRDARLLTDDRALDTGPAFSPDGRHLYFSSDRRTPATAETMVGIANLYRMELATGRTEQVTNVIAGAYSPDVSPDGRHLVYLGYTSRGFDLFVLDLEQLQPRLSPEISQGRDDAIAVEEPALQSERYRPYRTLYPRSYQVEVNSDTFGQRLGVLLTGSDIAGFHDYSLRAGISLNGGHAHFDLSWGFNHLLTPIRINAFREVTERRGLQISGENLTWIQDARGIGISTAYNLPRRFHSQRFGIGYNLTDIRKGAPFGGRLIPDAPLPRLPELGLYARLSVDWTYSTRRRRLYDMHAAAGRSLSLRLSVVHPSIGAQFTALNFSYAFTQHIRVPWAKNHAFALRYAGGISGGDEGRRRFYSVGGFPQVDLISALLNQQSQRGVALRGYPIGHRRGQKFQLLQFEYRFPIIRLMRGVQTLPLFIQRAYALVFVDVGDAWTERFDIKRLQVGFGAELFLDFTVGYFVPFTLRTGLAYGAMEDGGLQFYSNLGVPF